jgi:hypothetical protein
VNKKEWEGILLALFEGLFMASVLVQYYDIENHIERVGTVLKVQMITDIDKSFIVFVLFMIVPVNSDRIWRVITNYIY